MNFFLKILLFLGFASLAACVAMPEDAGRSSPAPEFLPGGNASGNDNSYQPSRKAASKPPQSKFNDEVNPAVINLISSARDLKNRGEYPACAAKLERALRIDPESVSAYTLLAEVRLLQEQNLAAEQLARKAMAILAQRKRSSNKELQMEHLRLIVAEARSERH
ncbi:MAG TPA: hypothetical protein VIM85_02215 [Pseudomonadales bacterium]